MKEALFVKNNLERWEEFERMLRRESNVKPDELADLFIQITDDLSYSRTHYPGSETVHYLNNLALKAHHLIYKNKKEKGNRFGKFWRYEVPLAVQSAHKHIFYSLVIFLIAALIGAVSTAHDDTYVRLIMGDGYVNMTLENIKNGEPMGVYGSMPQSAMFYYITFPNIGVSLKVFTYGILLPALGTFFALFSNGIMLGSFQYFFVEQGLFLTSFLTIWIHGTLEISAIVIAGGAGLKVGASILFPDTYSRIESFKMGAKTGIKIIIGLMPIWITAGFLESFVTRLFHMPSVIKAAIIILSAFFILYYFVIYPIKLAQNGRPDED